MAVLENDTRRALHLELLDGCPDMTAEVLGEVPEELAGIVKVIDARPYRLKLWYDSLANEVLLARDVANGCVSGDGSL